MYNPHALVKTLKQEVMKSRTMSILISIQKKSNANGLGYFRLTPYFNLPIFLPLGMAYTFAEDDVYFVSDFLSELSDKGKKAYQELLKMRAKK